MTTTIHIERKELHRLHAATGKIWIEAHLRALSAACRGRRLVGCEMALLSIPLCTINYPPPPLHTHRGGELELIRGF